VWWRALFYRGYGDYSEHDLAPEDRLVHMREIKEKCLQCGETLFTKARRDGTGQTTLDRASDLKLESEEFTPLLRCPNCRAKNVVKVRNSFGGTEVAVTHLLSNE
jgi:DNA-directed RNA polymerase subunit RPC12/RpoP